jgi:hypothetical protein
MFPIIFEDVCDLDLYQSVYDELVDGWSMCVRTLEKTNINRHWGKETRYDLIFLKAASYIQLKIKKFIKQEINLCKIVVNGQTRGQESFLHKDFDESYFLTFVLFTSPSWDTNWGGDFVCFDELNNTYKHVLYKPNRGVLIPSNWDHVGQGPNLNTHELRTSVAFSFVEARYKKEAVEKYANSPHFRLFS